MTSAPADASPPAADIAARLDGLRAVLRRQLFFVGGAPRSGTTWLQHLLDGHPEVSCRGEGLFWKELALPLKTLTEARAGAIDTKNRELFSHTGGYPPPGDGDTDLLLGAGILAGLETQIALRDDPAACRAVGEKTPENLFFFPRLHALFPQALLIAIFRDPRDVIASAWHAFVQRRNPGRDMSAGKLDFVRLSLEPMDGSARRVLSLLRAEPAACIAVTYEALHRDPAGVLGALFRFLRVSDDPDIAERCIARSDFERMSGGRRRGETSPDAFLRKGTVGGWRDTLDEEANAIILDKLGWMFPRFGWAP